MIKTIDGTPVAFQKAQRSHVDGRECLYVGAPETGDSVYLFESGTPEDVLVQTTRANFAAFLDGAKKGEFDQFAS